MNQLTSAAAGTDWQHDRREILGDDDERHIPMMLCVGTPTASSCRNADNRKTAVLHVRGPYPLPIMGKYTCLFMNWYTGLFHNLQ